jgi:TRAP-type transport system periplasmic protein
MFMKLNPSWLRQRRAPALAGSAIVLCMATSLSLAPGLVHAQEGPYVQETQKTLRLAHGVSPGMAYDRGAHRFAELLDQYSRRALRVRIFPSAQLGLEQDTAKDVQLGTLDLTLIAVNNASMWYRPLDVLILPFLFRDREHANTVVNGPVGEELFENYREASGVRIISVFEWGDRGIINRMRPIEQPDDLRGVKIRLPMNPVMLDTYNALGATTAAIDWGELYSALQQGVADGLEGPPKGMLDMKFTDFLEYYSYIPVFYGLAVILMNDAAFQALPEPHQDAILRAGREAGDYQRWISAVEHVDGIKLLEEAGVKVNVVTDLEPFVSAVEPIYEKYGPAIGAEWIERVRNAR